MIAVEAAVEEARAQRAIVVPLLVQLGEDLAAGAGELGGLEVGAQDDVGQQGQEGLEVAGQHVAGQARGVGIDVKTSPRSPQKQDGRKHRREPDGAQNQHTRQAESADQNI